MKCVYRNRAITATGCALLLCGLIIILCCVPFWLWVAILGCMMSALGIFILLG